MKSTARERVAALSADLREARDHPDQTEHDVDEVTGDLLDAIDELLSEDE